MGGGVNKGIVVGEYGVVEGGGGGEKMESLKKKKKMEKV